MFRISGFFYLLLICSLQQATSNEYPTQWYGSSAIVRGGRQYDKLQEVFQSYPVDRSNTDQTLQYFKTCAGLTGRREIEHLTSWRYALRRFTSPRLSKPCYSVLRNCYFEEPMDDDIRYCTSNDPTRRYDYMERRANPLKNGIIYGHKSGECDLSKVEEFFPYGPYTSTCVCDCESSEKEVDRYFSLLDVLPDDDKVVTGVRFRKVDHVFYIQIQQGKLGKNRRIVGKAEWKNIETISKDDLLSTRISYYYEVYNDNDVKFEKNDLVYAVTSQQNTVLLDELEAGPNEVVTGVRFQQVGDDLRLEILVTPFHNEYGLATIKPASRWVFNHNDKSQRKPAELGTLAIPTPHTVMDIQSPAGTYVQFQTSDFKKDLGQTTVPLIEIQDIFTEYSRPLFGVGISYIGSKNTAGFISLTGKYEAL